MIRFLDTDTCVNYLRGKNPRVRERLAACDPRTVRIPVIVKAELVLGALKSAAPQRSLREVERLLAPFEVVDFTDALVGRWAQTRADLERAGTPLGVHDLLIAAIVLHHDGIIVTDNVAEFGRVKGLRTESWGAG